MFDRLEQVDESVVAGYDTLRRLIHLDVKKNTYIRTRERHIHQVG